MAPGIHDAGCRLERLPAVVPPTAGLGRKDIREEHCLVRMHSTPPEAAFADSLGKERKVLMGTPSVVGVPWV